MSPSFLMRVATLELKRRGKALAAGNVAKLREQLLSREYPAPAPIPKSLRRLCDVREDSVHGQPVYTLVPKQARSLAHVIYTHGGAYVNPLVKEHWGIIEAIMRRAGASFTVPLYPLAPENDHRPAFAMLDEVYHQVTRKVNAANVALVGDSAGAGLALAMAMRCRDQGQQMPARVILFSPWLDITMCNPNAVPIEAKDVILGIEALRFCGQCWSGTADGRSPHLSPLFGDLSRLPPIDVFQGTHDVFLADARLFRERVLATGGRVNLYEYAGAFHVFVAATFAREAKQALETVAHSLKSMVADRPGTTPGTRGSMFGASF